MSDYLLIESRDPFESGCSHYQSMARDIVVSGSKVTLFLVENGVLPARQCHFSASLNDIAAQGVEVLADEFSLRERGISPENLTAGVSIAPLEVIIDLMVAGRKVLWH